MENASKALIIAGAILLSILIIALGIYVFNMAKGSFDGNQLSEMEKSTFNQQFSIFEGKQAGSTIKNLIDKIIANASTNSGAQDRLPTIKYIKGNGSTANQTYTFNVQKTSSTEANSVNNCITKMNELRAKISDRHIYKVSYTMDTDGLVDVITIDYGN